MAKGDDAVRKKKNKVIRKRMRNSESSVSVRVASIIASKRRRKAGKRRISEGMCFSLPTPEDPFNDRYEKKNIKDDKKKDKPKIKKPPFGKPKPNSTLENQEKETTAVAKPAGYGDLEDGSIMSKFFTRCLNAIQKSWKQEEEGDEDDNDEEGNLIWAANNLLESSWGAGLWRHCSSGSNVVDTRSEGCATKEQIAWMLSIATYIVATKEKEEHVLLVHPFLLYLVSSRERAAEVRSVSKPLKAHGVHTVSLHSGTSIEHQIQGLKSLEPEFVVATPERLLELVHLQAVDLSGVSLLVLDDLKSLVDFGFFDKVISIKERIPGEAQVVVFSDSLEETSPSLQNLLKGPYSRLCLDDSPSTEEE